MLSLELAVHDVLLNIFVSANAKCKYSVYLYYKSTRNYHCVSARPKSATCLRADV
jgi:hypothetical protein